MNSYCHPRRIKVLLLAVAAMIFVILVPASCGGGKEGEVTIYIAAGSTTEDIARQLIDEEVINSEREFTKKADELGIDQKLRPGTYLFQRGEPIEEILRKLEQGIQAPEGVLTVPEGYRIDEIALAVADKTEITEKEFINAAQVDSRQVPLRGGENATDLEGLLFPSTYDLEPEISADDIVAMQISAFQEMTSGEEWGNAAAMGLTEYQALIVASLIEREARVPDERPLVAAVIYNRLADGMKLEVDATVQYALGYWKADLTQDDLEIDSAYNTRLYGGLPPTPICNPGLDSITAALNPAPVDYLYYVATGDEEGHHFFTRSYEEFLKMKDS